MTNRKVGLLMPIASLPNKYGIGDFGLETYKFVDLLADTKIDLWQILPLNPLGYGESPYQPYSSHAMDELYISLDGLYDLGLITKPKIKVFNEQFIDYENIRKYKNDYFLQAYNNFISKPKVFKELTIEFNEFKKQSWALEYAIFITFKKQNNFICWNLWQDDYRDFVLDNNQKLLAKHHREIEYEIFVQFILFKQFYALKNYINQHHIELIGDIPFYVGIDSDDVYFNRQQFLLNDDGSPSCVAGVPPDYFSETGQRWGNPIYNWDLMKSDNYAFWLERINHNTKMYDIIRLDHFRAFDTYWKINSACETAIDGEWVINDGYAFFDLLFNKLPDIKLIAEDLGDIRPEVLSLRDHYQLKGMRVLQFTLDINTDNKGIENEVCYSGTHDNDTLLTWFENLPEHYQNEIKHYLHLNGYNYAHVIDNLIKLIIDGRSAYRIIPLADILHLAEAGRINTPGTLGHPNWAWRISDYKATKERFSVLKLMIEENNGQYQ